LEENETIWNIHEIILDNDETICHIMQLEALDPSNSWPKKF